MNVVLAASAVLAVVSFKDALDLGSFFNYHCFRTNWVFVRVETDEDVKFVDGMMYPSARPGLGIELNEEAAAKHLKQGHWLRHYVGTLTNVRPPDSVKYFHS